MSSSEVQGAKIAGVAIVIPTRNRVDLAKLAISSALAVDQACVSRIVVSDNSTDRADARELDRFMDSIGDARLVLIRPQDPLSMTAHWNWVMARVLAMAGATHVTFLTDRMVFRRLWFEEACALSRRFPGDIISYADDRVQDDRRPVVYAPSVRSGKTFRIESMSLLEQSARMSFFTCLPRMMNCIVPKAHLDVLKSKHGQYFSSISPDFCFCYRTLASADSIVYLDKSVLVSHGYDRSNGHSFIKGKTTETSEDFISQLPRGGTLCGSTPLPDVHTVGNAIVNEYVKVREEYMGALPPLSTPAYLTCLAAETWRFDDPAKARAVRKRLASAGWRPDAKFSWQMARVRLMAIIHSLIEHRFSDPAAAMRAAVHEPTFKVSWLHRVARPYRATEIT